MLWKPFPVPPIVVDIIFICLVTFWIFWCNIPIASPCSSITLITQWLSTYRFAEPWPTFEMSTANQFFLLKPSMTSSCYLRKFSIDICVSTITESILWWKGWWVVSLYLSDASLPIIPRNPSWNIRTVAARIRLNFVFCVSCVLWKNRHSKKKITK